MLCTRNFLRCKFRRSEKLLRKVFISCCLFADHIWETGSHAAFLTKPHTKFSLPRSSWERKKRLVHCVCHPPKLRFSDFLSNSNNKALGSVFIWACGALVRTLKCSATACKFTLPSIKTLYCSLLKKNVTVGWFSSSSMGVFFYAKSVH